MNIRLLKSHHVDISNALAESFRGFFDDRYDAVLDGGEANA